MGGGWITPPMGKGGFIVEEKVGKMQGILSHGQVGFIHRGGIDLYTPPLKKKRKEGFVLPSLFGGDPHSMFYS